MKELSEICDHVRNSLETLEIPSSVDYLELLENFPKGCCKVSSLILMQYLVDYHGVSKDELSLMANAKVGTATHAWILYNDLHIDITADQFKKPKIIISEINPWPKSSPDRFPFSDELQNPDYKKELLEICKQIHSQPARGPYAVNRTIFMPNA